MAAHVLRVDPIACTGEGVCADLFPEWIRLDDWGFPIIDADVIPADRLAQARWAAANCPALALKLQAVPRSRSGAAASAVGSVRQGPG
jgi:ferredoxin